MKKIIISFSILSIFTTAHASLDTCLRDAKTHGNHISPVSPGIECVEIIRSHPENIKLVTSDKKYNLFGLFDMLYVESSGVPTLLSGDQTELEEILKIEVNESKKRIIVLQKNSVSTFDLGFIGNVSPLSYFKSPIIKGASRVKLLDNEEIIAIFNKASIRLVNSNAESRHETEKTKPKLLNEISGEESQLKSPSDLLIDSTDKKIYVLDSNRLLVFAANVKKDQAPLKIVNLNEARSLKQKENLIYYVNSQGQDVKAKQEN